ncbi:MAG: purine-nucleoside phosphorylase [Candidatus Sumerlaeaceae bacterium]|nr:purine-nucleoside phosphorylase [Candidatus Sumerlaeaceae bacterium]
MAPTAEPMSEAEVAKVRDSARFLIDRFPAEAKVLVIAGSGLGGFVRSVVPELAADYSDIPHFGASTVAGHAGRLVLGRVGETPIFLMCGRRHLYEGISPQQAVLLLRALLVAFPLEIVVVSNAAGGLNPKFEVGDLMLISDHINWMFRNPLVGRNEEQWGPRFPDASELYSRKLREIAKRVAREIGILLREGVYVGGLGPTYETRAEVHMLRTIHGADAVGMSTVPETLVAAHMGRKVLGISFISNLLTVPAVTTHEEVMENSRLVEQKFSRLLTALIPRIV